MKRTLIIAALMLSFNALAKNDWASWKGDCTGMYLYSLMINDKAHVVTPECLNNVVLIAGDYAGEIDFYELFSVSTITGINKIDEEKKEVVFNVTSYTAKNGCNKRGSLIYAFSEADRTIYTSDIGGMINKERHALRERTFPITPFSDLKLAESTQKLFKEHNIQVDDYISWINENKLGDLVRNKKLQELCLNSQPATITIPVPESAMEKVKELLKNTVVKNNILKGVGITINTASGGGDVEIYDFTKKDDRRTIFFSEKGYIRSSPLK